MENIKDLIVKQKAEVDKSIKETEVELSKIKDKLSKLSKLSRFLDKQLYELYDGAAEGKA